MKNNVVRLKRTQSSNFIAFVLILGVFSLNKFATGDGENCMQNGMGPSDLYQNGQMNKKYMWPKSGHYVEVPVVLDHYYTNKERRVILGGLQELEQKTCVRFHIYNYTGELEGTDHVYIHKQKKGCWSHVGRIGGRQELSLARGCINHRTSVHEMIHALGFAHEHVRSDRDEYVRIYWENIQPGRESNFRKRNTKSTDPYGPYDYDSVMHYDKRAFSMNGKDTIKPLKYGAQIGVRQTMSYWDQKKLLRMYKCGKGHGYGGGGGGGYSGYSPEDETNQIVDEENDVQHQDHHHHNGHEHDHDHHHRHPHGHERERERDPNQFNPYFYDETHVPHREENDEHGGLVPESPQIQGTPEGQHDYHHHPVSPPIPHNTGIRALTNDDFFSFDYF